MDQNQKIITQLPVVELWDGQGLISSTKVKELGEPEVIDLLRTGVVQFVVADVGKPFEWIPINERFEFWKNEVRPHLANTEKAHLDDFPDSYCYFASEWKSDAGETIILVSKAH